MGHRIEIRGKAKVYVGIAFLLIIVWLVFGQTLLSFNFGFFNRGYQTSLFRSGYLEKSGLRWDEHDRTLGRVISLGDESLVLDLSAEITRGTLVILAWRWPGFLFDEPIVHRSRFTDQVHERLHIALPSPGLYLLSVSAINLGGDVAVDWRVGGID